MCAAMLVNRFRGKWHIMCGCGSDEGGKKYGSTQISPEQDDSNPEVNIEKGENQESEPAAEALVVQEEEKDLLI